MYLLTGKEAIGPEIIFRTTGKDDEHGG